MAATGATNRQIAEQLFLSPEPSAPTSTAPIPSWASPPAQN
ncbi:hypothetical protein [Kribbella sp. HUAS MG21]